MNEAPLVFIWIGNKLPSYTKDSIYFCKKNNPDRLIYLLTDALIINRELYEYASIVEIKKQSLVNFQNEMPNLHYEGLFWINTSMRFWVLNEFINEKNINKFFHAELDNAIFNLDKLDTILDNVGVGLFAPRDSEARAIASLIYCNRSKSIYELTSLYKEENPPQHDMEALGIYSKKFQNYFFALPTESYHENYSIWNLIEPDKINGIFDAAAIGQYFLGVDPIHCRCKPCRNRFINENCKIDFNEVVFNVKNSNIFIEYKFNKIQYKIYNLHLHSKNWRKFNKMMSGTKLINKLNQGQTLIISNHIMLFAGPFCYLSGILLYYINRIMKILKFKFQF